MNQIRNAIRRADERARHRREYEMLLQSGDQMFRDIGVQRADVERMHRKVSLF
ncbi:hypothetical protein [Oricola sp.]|uniref:hypothetical protein n=1 Tax=Oricola sp. TaxID=1979950 RepID=UPI0025EF5F33|nr:hypothetical protein [Oricola sp.]MCI5075896.1 hypothetical protein [Oricola sp.]